MEIHDVVIVGAGQAGLALAQALRRRGIEPVLLDAAPEIGWSWRRRWDSLRLFTPAEHSSLPGLPFPAPAGHYPSKDEVADYLQAYARTFDLDVRTSAHVQRLRRHADAFLLDTNTGPVAARRVVAATGPFQAPFVPDLARGFAPEVVQLHSDAYQSPADIPAGCVLVVGGGNSGVQIAQELARHRQVILSVGQKLPGLPERWWGRSIFWWLERIGFMTIERDTRLGRILRRRDVIIGTPPAQLAREWGIDVVGRLVEVDGRRARFERGRTRDIDVVVWATGYRTDFSWAGGEGGQPPEVLGFDVLGLSWQRTRGSALLGWIGRDAERLAESIAEDAAARQHLHAALAPAESVPGGAPR